MSLDKQFPMLAQFRRALDSRQVARQLAESFDKWRTGKCPEGSPQRVEADALWQRYAGLDEASKRGPVVGPRTQLPGARPGFDRRGGAPVGRGRHGSAPQRGDNRDAAEPALLGEPFHNPYTFLPFPKQAAARRRPTPLSVDEDSTQRDRRTGILELRLHTLSPLLSCSPEGEGKKGEHRTYRALTIAGDPIVPASGVRGSLRNLLTILTGGTLGYLDDSLWLTQGRDLPLGPRREKAPNPNVPKHVFLARVERPGSPTRSGTIQLGRTVLVSAAEVERLLGADAKTGRPTDKRPTNTWFVDRELQHKSTSPSAQTPWQLKLSGRPVNTKGKREAIFLADDSEPLTLEARLWADYTGRHAHGAVDELRGGDLVWLEPMDREATAIREAKDIRSLQWSRWGRAGEKLLDVIRRHHKAVEPDSFRADGLVDEITDLFGQVPFVEGAAGPFAGRVRPENLVFAGVRADRAIALAPLQPPHPGCAAFYRDSDDIDRLSNHGLPLRGYKVYRTTRERGADAPWSFTVQGVYREDGSLDSPRQKVNKSVELIPERSEGTLRIAFRALAPRELALLLLACCVDWRLGGGKSLGLGHCRVLAVQVLDEFGTPQERMSPDGRGIDDLPVSMRDLVTDLKARVSLWQASQVPVERMRYPRAVSDNNNRKQRGGHAWFQRHTSPRKGGGDQHPQGLEVMWVQGALQQEAGGKDRIRAQPLPAFDPEDPEHDRLYGYDLISPRGASEQDRDRRTLYSAFAPFDPEQHKRGDERSGGAQSQSGYTRRQKRDERDRGKS